MAGRIIAGTAGGRRIAMPAGDRTRPTTDRVREALFSVLASWAGRADQPGQTALAGFAFCDLYAGSGAVGLEAASRGAAPVLLVESDRRTAGLARRNAAVLDLRAEVRSARVEEVLATGPDARFDLVFADPPYALPTESVEEVAARVAAGWLAPDGLFVVERSRRTSAPRWPDALPETWSRDYGETTLWFAAARDEASRDDEIDR